MNRKKYWFIGAIVSFIITNTYIHDYARALSNTTTITLQGSVSLSGAGSWSSGISLSGNVNASQTSVATWSGSTSTDYLLFTDSSQSPGSYIKIYVQNEKFSYSGGGQGNTGTLRAENLYLETNSNPTRGTNDSSKNINFISSESCGVAGTGNFTLHTNFYSSSQNNRLRLGAGLLNSKILVRSSATCTTTTKLFLNSIKLYFPSLTTAGSYSNSLIFLAVDGQP